MIELSKLTDLIAARSAGLKLYARQWVDACSAEDVLQDALVALLSSATVPDDPVAWMYRTVRNGAIDAARSVTRRRAREKEFGSNKTEWFETPLHSLLDAAETESVLRRLPVKYREAIVLRLWGGLQFDAIGKVLNVSVSNAHTRYNAALKFLKDEMEKECGTKQSSRTR